MKFACKVITRASKNKVVGAEALKWLNSKDRGRDTNKKELPQLKIYLTAVPLDGKANRELIKLLSKELGVAKSKISIVKGEKSSKKIIQVDE